MAEYKKYRVSCRLEKDEVWFYLKCINSKPLIF